MKIVLIRLSIFLLLLLVLAKEANAQHIVFSYDAAGNRTIREKDPLMYNCNEETNNKDERSNKQIEDSLDEITVKVSYNSDKKIIQITIENVSDFEHSNIYIYGTDGKLKLQWSTIIEINTLNISSLPAGIYYLVTNVNGQIDQWKIVIE